MKVAYHIILHSLGIGCVAACIAIVATLGGLDIHWAGWIAVGFLSLLAFGIIAGWFPWRGKPLRVLLKGLYLMSALALIGFGFAMDDPLKPQWWMVLAPLGAAIVLRVIFRIATRSAGKAEEAPAAQEGTRQRSPVNDSIFK